MSMALITASASRPLSLVALIFCTNCAPAQAPMNALRLSNSSDAIQGETSLISSYLAGVDRALISEVILILRNWRG